MEPKETIFEDDVLGRTFAVDDTELPRGHYTSIYFLGSIFAIGLSLATGVAGFSLVAPILGSVNEDIGPSTYIVWVALTYSLTGAASDRGTSYRYLQSSVGVSSSSLWQRTIY